MKTETPPTTDRAAASGLSFGSRRPQVRILSPRLHKTDGFRPTGAEHGSGPESVSESIRRPFITPPSTKAERIRANGLVNKRIKLGHFTPPTQCMRCSTECGTLDKHHPDYSRPDEVFFLCRACHKKAHHRPGFLAGMTPLKVGLNPALRKFHKMGGRRGPTGKAKGRHPLRRILHTREVAGMMEETLACGHQHRREPGKHISTQRRCRQCPRSDTLNLGRTLAEGGAA